MITKRMPSKILSGKIAESQAENDSRRSQVEMKLIPCGLADPAADHLFFRLVDRSSSMSSTSLIT